MIKGYCVGFGSDCFTRHTGSSRADKLGRHHSSDHSGFVTALIRSIVKGNRFFSGDNLYLGIDLSFAGLAASMVESLDLIREHLLNGDETQFLKVLTALALCFGSAIALLGVTKLHQTWDVPPPKTAVIGKVRAERDQQALNENHRIKRFRWLGIASNGLGFATIVVFAWLRAR